MLRLNTENVHKLLKSFYTLCKVRIVLLDTSYERVISYPERQVGFCQMVRSDPATNDKCVACDKDGCRRCAERGELTIYRCHAGLLEAVVPITDEHGILGYIMFGQIMPQEGGEDIVRALEKAFPEKRFPGIRTQIRAIEVKTPEEIESAATVLQAIASYVLTNRWVAPEKAEFIRHLDRYIIAHIREPIRVEDLCVEFGISRTRLYEIASAYLGMPLASYIRRSRVDYAKTLLMQTDLSIAAVAEASGFSDYNRFSRIFRSVAGTTAREYRYLSRHS